MSLLHCAHVLTRVFADAKDITRGVETALGTKGPSALPPMTIAKLQDKAIYVYTMPNPDEDHVDSSVAIYLQVRCTCSRTCGRFCDDNFCSGGYSLDCRISLAHSLRTHRNTWICVHKFTMTIFAVDHVSSSVVIDLNAGRHRIEWHDCS